MVLLLSAPVILTDEILKLLSRTCVERRLGTLAWSVCVCVCVGGVFGNVWGEGEPAPAGARRATMMPWTFETGQGKVGTAWGGKCCAVLAFPEQQNHELPRPVHHPSVLSRGGPSWRQALGWLRRDWGRGVNYSPIVGTLDLTRKDSDDFGTAMRPST